MTNGFQTTASRLKFTTRKPIPFKLVNTEPEAKTKENFNEETEANEQVPVEDQDIEPNAQEHDDRTRLVNSPLPIVSKK